MYLQQERYISNKIFITQQQLQHILHWVLQAVDCGLDVIAQWTQYYSPGSLIKIGQYLSPV